MSSNQSFFVFLSHEETGANQIFEIVSMETIISEPLHNHNHLEMQENSKDEHAVFDLLDVGQSIELIDS